MIENPLMPLFTRTLRLKVKAESSAWLNAAAIEVNQVFNYCNETSFLAATRTDTKRKWLSGFDLCYLTAGASEHFERIGAGTIQRICIEYAQKRRATKRLKLRWRVSRGARRTLGWVPFKAESLKCKGKSLRFCGKRFRVFERDRLDSVRYKQGCFAQDAVGDWWLCLPVEVEASEKPAPQESVGIDLGLKSVATTSDGEELAAGRFYRDSEPKIARAQCAHKRQLKRLHRKAARRRLDALHKFSRKIVDRYQNIVVGDVSSLKLAKTRMAKSVLDSGWGMLKGMLLYKGEHAGRSIEIINESYTTRACSSCGALTGPSGPRALVVRQWECVGCGAAHDRDVNAAKNILIAGSRCGPPCAGTSQRTYRSCRAGHLARARQDHNW